MQAERRTPLKSSRANSARRLFILISTITFTFDLATKNWAESFLQGRDSIKVIGEFLQLTYATNPGAAFSFFEDATLLLSALKLAVVGFIIFFIRQVTNKYWASSLALLFGGVLGNLYDRALRPPGVWRGEVIDWIELPNWPVFNLADSAIVSAGIAMTILALFNISHISKEDEKDSAND